MIPPAPVVAFFEGTPAYNVANLGVGVVSLFLTVGSVVAASRAARSADAARSEAEQVRRLFGGMSAGVGLSGARGYLREAVARLEGGSLVAAVQCVAFVREELSRQSRSAGGQRVATPQDWWVVDRELGDVADVLRQTHAVDPAPTRLEVAELAGRLFDVGVTLAKLQAGAETLVTGD